MAAQQRHPGRRIGGAGYAEAARAAAVVAKARLIEASEAAAAVACGLMKERWAAGWEATVAWGCSGGHPAAGPVSGISERLSGLLANIERAATSWAGSARQEHRLNRRTSSDCGKESSIQGD